MRQASPAVVLSLLLVAAGPSAAAPAGDPVPEPLFDGLGGLTRKVTTSVPEAQRYFDQGLSFMYGFNHDEAIRSFRRAAELDPKCAMAEWGVAIANGPHINNPVVPEDHAKAAWEALVKAQAMAEGASPVEKALIVALAARYAQPQPQDRKPLDLAYANAMRSVWAAFPKDPDVGTLFAEAMADLRPWDFWTPDGKPQPGTEEMIAALEAVLRLDPRHPLALHLTIHALEASTTPGARTRPPTRCGTASRASGTWSTCRPTSTCAGGAGRRRSPPTRRRSRRTRATPRARPSRASTGSTWPTTTTC